MVKFASTSRGHQVYEDEKLLLPLAQYGLGAAGVGTFFGSEFQIPDSQAVLCSLRLTVSATTEVLDTLDVTIQTFIGGDWVDACYFTQIAGTTAAQIELAKLVGSAAQALLVSVPLAAGNIRGGLMGSKWRARYAVVAGGGTGTHAWTFSVSVQPIK